MKDFCIALFAGTVGCAMTLHIPAAEAAKAKETVVWSFGDGTDGAGPYASLINIKGTLYGTTQLGGTNGGGTVFSITPDGTETVLYSFCSQQSCADGYHPLASLINVKGTLYGTTGFGGTNDGGTVFSITLDGTETLLHSFQGDPDGDHPYASLINVKGTLYGTTQLGGTYGDGTVFSITPDDTETVLHSFGSRRGRGGSLPDASLINVKGTLYGTTYSGGTNRRYHGTVFSITPGGTHHAVLHSFRGSPDGNSPGAGLINVKGTLYGTTGFGGTNDGGTVFSITLDGTETVLYSFCSQQNCADGNNPEASLINVKGMLYGTTFGGGTNGSGTVFSIDPTTGAETVLHSFCSQQNCTDGSDPVAGVIDVKGTLYGTTKSGGAYGQGTVFEVKP